MRTTLSTVAAIALMGASAPFAVQADPAVPNYQIAAGEGEQGGASGASETGQSSQSTSAKAPETAILQQQESGQMLADKLIGASVRTAGGEQGTASGEQGEEIGTINDLVLDSNHRVTAAVIGVGGFLGIGEKNVAVRFDHLKRRQAEGRTVYVADLTREQLEQAPEFKMQGQGSSGAMGDDQESGSSGSSQ